MISCERYFVISKPLQASSRLFYFQLNLNLTILKNFKAKCLLSKKILVKCIILIWVLGVLMATPFIWITNYEKALDECDLNLTFVYLVYIISLNIIFVVLPMIVLTYFYIGIIIKSKKNYKSIQSMFAPIHIKMEKTSTSSARLSRQPSEVDPLKISNIQSMRLRENLDNNDKEKSSSSVFKLKAKQKFKSTAKISILTVLSFWCQVPIRLFTCWSYTSAYSSKLGQNYYESFIGNNYKTIFIYFNVSTIVYFLNLVFNCIIYNIFSVEFRKEIKKFFGL